MRTSFGHGHGFGRGPLRAGGGLPDTMTFQISSGSVYTRTPFDATRDLVQRIRISGAAAPLNDPVAAIGAKLIPAATARDGMVTAYGVSSTWLAAQGDDPPPLRYNNSFIGGSHGTVATRNIAATGHGKTAADIGSDWLSGAGTTFRLMYIPNANSLWMLALNTGTTELWVFPSTLAASGTLTHVAGATNTADINFTTVAAVQLTPSLSRHTKTVRINGGAAVSDDGVYDCNFVEIDESYSIVNPASLAAYLAAGRPWATAPALNDDAVDVQVSLRYRHRVADNGSMTVNVRVTNPQTLNLNTNNGYYSGGVQAGALTFASGSGETLHAYVPKVNAVGGVDYEAVADISGTISQADFTSATWKTAGDPGDRMAQFVQDSGTIKQFGFVLGYSRLSGFGANLPAYCANKSGFIAASKKMYPHALTNTATAYGSFALTLPADSVFEGESYRIFYDLTGIQEATVSAVRLFNGGAEVILDFHENVAAYAVPVPAKLNGKAVAIVESNGNLSLDSASVANGEITVTVTGGYGSAVLSVL